jgi:hypothetical protein
VGNSLGSDDQALRNCRTDSIRGNKSSDAGRPDSANATYPANTAYSTDPANASYPTNAADPADSA